MTSSPSFRVVSHVIADIVHGGYDDGPGLTLWLDTSTNVAHLTGHSGSFIPLKGPLAPQGAPSWEAVGATGMIRIFTTDEIAEIVSDLTDVLAQTEDDPTGRADGIETILREAVQEDESYADWLAANEPDTYQDLYG